MPLRYVSSGHRTEETGSFPKEKWLGKTQWASGPTGTCAPGCGLDAGGAEAARGGSTPVAPRTARSFQPGSMWQAQ